MSRRRGLNERFFPLEIGNWAFGTDYYDREQDWLDKAWQKVKKSVSADDDLRDGRLAIKAISLGLIYLDFCKLGWDETVCRDYADWARVLGITPQLLKKMAAPNISEDDEDDDYQYSDLILLLANNSREEVFDILCPNINNYPEMVADLAAIKDSSEFANILDKVAPWFYEKCYYNLYESC